MKIELGEVLSTAITKGSFRGCHWEGFLCVQRMEDKLKSNIAMSMRWHEMDLSLYDSLLKKWTMKGYNYPSLETLVVILCPVVIQWVCVLPSLSGGTSPGDLENAVFQPIVVEENSVIMHQCVLLLSVLN